MPFQDHFSPLAKPYAIYRPHYPAELFAYLSKLTPHHDLAWDCATGNGQAASELAKYFTKVIATDASASQIANAVTLPNIEYRVEPAEQTTLLDASIDLITVAQAYHWFDIPVFAKEAKRVLKPGGVITVWCYDLLHTDPAIEQIINNFYYDITGPYWPKNRRLIDEKYQTINFPFTPLPTPTFYMYVRWNLTELLGYLSTWSAVQYYIKDKNTDPVAELAPTLAAAWGDVQVPRKITWQLYLRAGTNEN